MSLFYDAAACNWNAFGAINNPWLPFVKISPCVSVFCWSLLQHLSIKTGIGSEILSVVSYILIFLYTCL